MAVGVVAGVTSLVIEAGDVTEAAVVETVTDAVEVAPSLLDSSEHAGTSAHSRMTPTGPARPRLWRVMVTLEVCQTCAGARWSAGPVLADDWHELAPQGRVCAKPPSIGTKWLQRTIR